MRDTASGDELDEIKGGDLLYIYATFLRSEVSLETETSQHTKCTPDIRLVRTEVFRCLSTYFSAVPTGLQLSLARQRATFQIGAITRITTDFEIMGCMHGGMMVHLSRGM